MSWQYGHPTGCSLRLVAALPRPTSTLFVSAYWRMASMTTGWQEDMMLKFYWGRPLTTRVAGAPLFWGVRIGRWLLGRIGRSA